jgi:uncharacterized protein YpiB (UPF0302 family)
MEVVRLILAILFITAHVTDAFVITTLTDYVDFDENCVVDYVQETDIDRRCRNKVAKYRSSFYETIRERLTEPDECAVNQLERYNVSEVLLRAIAYNYNPCHFVTFNAVESCEGVLKWSNNSVFRDNCGYNVTIVTLSQHNKSLGKLRHCVNDLFRERQLDTIIFVDDADDSRSELGARSFGRHATAFVEQLTELAANLCDENLIAPHNEALERLYNFTGKFDAAEVGTILEEITVIDLFGFTQPSKKVERCIIDEYRWRFTNQNLLRVYDEAPERNLRNLRDFTRVVLDCLKFF